MPCLMKRCPLMGNWIFDIRRRSLYIGTLIPNSDITSLITTSPLRHGSGYVILCSPITNNVVADGSFPKRSDGFCTLSLVSSRLMFRRILDDFAMSSDT